MRRFGIIALMTTLALTSVGAETIGDPEPPALIMESPPRDGNCRPSTSTMTGPTTSYPSATLTVSNRSSSTANDALIINVVVDEVKRMLWVPLDLKPGSSKTIKVDYLIELESNIISICGDRPTQIVEDPQPVATVVVEQNPIEY